MRKRIIVIIILALLLVVMIIHSILTIGVWLTLLVFALCAVPTFFVAYILYLILPIDDETYESY